MNNPWIFRVAALLALGMLVVVVSGSLVTTNATLVEPAAGLNFLSTGHRHGAMGFSVIALAFLAWVAVVRKTQARLGWTLCGGVLMEGVFGSATLTPFNPPLMNALHATLAHLLAAGLVVFAVRLSPLWERNQESVRDYGWPSMRSLAISVPAFVVIQVALGAMFRQRMLGLMPHVIGAMLVSLLILMMAAFVLHQFPTQRYLRGAARALMTVTFAQVFLGIAAFTLRSLPDQSPAAMLVTAAAHVGTGALTLSAAAALGALIRRHVEPKA